MKLAYKYYLLILLWLIISIAEIKAQPFTPVSSNASEVFKDFIARQTAQNNILITDKNIYVPGEQVWFKTFATNTNSDTANADFKNLFVDMVNEKDSVIEHLVLDNTYQNTSGAITLPASLPQGFYWIRCYNALQISNDNSNIFIHPLFVFSRKQSGSNLSENNTASISKNLNPIISFIPERLTAIPGIISTGVIYITNAEHQPLQLNGKLVNSKDSVIQTFTTNSFGMARLTFENVANEVYLIVYSVNNNVVKYQLPAANKKAVQLSVKNQTATTIKAFVTLEDGVPPTTATTILAVQHNRLYYAVVGKGTYSTTIPLDSFPGGIVKLLLFNENKMLTDARDIFIPKQNIKLSLVPDKENYAVRDSVNFHIKVTDANDKPVTSVISIAVQNEFSESISDSAGTEALPPFNEFLLDDWLNKHYYQYSADNIDLLMAAQKAFLLSAGVDKSRQDNDHAYTKSLDNITGQVLNGKKGISNRIITSSIKKNNKYFISADTTDKDGTFSLPLPQGIDSLQMMLQVTDLRNNQTTDNVQTDSFSYPHLTTPVILKQQSSVSDGAQAFIKKHLDDEFFLLQEKGFLNPVIVKTIKKNEDPFASKRLHPFSHIVTNDKFRYGGNDAVTNAVLMAPGVNLAFGDISVGAPYIEFSGAVRRPLIIMDGFEVSDSTVGTIQDFLNKLIPSDIDYIEVLRGSEAALYGARGAAGVISINTMHGGNATGVSPSHLKTITPLTYHVSPLFSMPDYSDEKIKNNTTPDNRSTIYWNGNILTDENGEATIQFYTADDKTNYVITVNGLIENGNLFYDKSTISVK